MKTFIQFLYEAKKMKNDPCWKGYQMVGTKKKNGKTVPNCVPEETVNEARGADDKGHFRSTESGAGMTQKGVEAYRRKNPGSKLKTAVTGKVKSGSKAANRRKSFCARMSGMKGPMKDEKGRPTRKAMSLRRWKC